MIRSIVAYSDMTADEAQTLLGLDVAYWPIDTQEQLVALFMHLHNNWDVRVVWLIAPFGPQNDAQRRLHEWWDGMDGLRIPLPKQDYHAILAWVQVQHASRIELDEAGVCVTTCVTPDLARRVGSIEDLSSPRS